MAKCILNGGATYTMKLDHIISVASAIIATSLSLKAQRNKEATCSQLHDVLRIPI